MRWELYPISCNVCAVQLLQHLIAGGDADSLVAFAQRDERKLRLTIGGECRPNLPPSIANAALTTTAALVSGRFDSGSVGLALRCREVASSRE